MADKCECDRCKKIDNPGNMTHISTSRVRMLGMDRDSTRLHLCLKCTTDWWYFIWHNVPLVEK